MGEGFESVAELLCIGAPPAGSRGRRVAGRGPSAYLTGLFSGGDPDTERRSHPEPDRPEPTAKVHEVPCDGLREQPEVGDLPTLRTRGRQLLRADREGDPGDDQAAGPQTKEDAVAGRSFGW